MKQMLWLLIVLSALVQASELRIEQGRSRLIDRVGVAEILVANSEIAEIRPLNDRVALLRAKSVGHTELYFMQGAEVVVSGVTVLTPGTALGGLELHLMVLETQAAQGQGGGLDLGIEVAGQSDNGSGSVTATGLLSWLPTAEQSGLRVLARPRLRMAPNQTVQLDVGGEIARPAAEGGTEDKVYGLEVTAEYQWTGARIQLSHEIQLRTPAGDQQFRRQGLKQTLEMSVGEVIEFARFDGSDLNTRQRQSGFSFGRTDKTQSVGHWRVIGWFEPLEEY